MGQNARFREIRRVLPRRNASAAVLTGRTAALVPLPGALARRGVCPARYGPATAVVVVFCTRRTASAKRVAFVGAPSTTAIRSRPCVRIHIAKQ